MVGVKLDESVRYKFPGRRGGGSGANSPSNAPKRWEEVHKGRLELTDGRAKVGPTFNRREELTSVSEPESGEEREAVFVTVDDLGSTIVSRY